MKEVCVCLPNADTVQRFVETLTGLGGNFDLISGPYILDARSLMGIFSLDLSEPIKLKIYNDTPETLAALAPFLAADPADPAGTANNKGGGV